MFCLIPGTLFFFLGKQMSLSDNVNVDSPKDQILSCDDQICQAIDACDAMGRTFVSKDILGQLRNFVEAVIVEIYNVAGTHDLAFSYKNLSPALAYCKSVSKYNFLITFHDFLGQSTSHYTAKGDNPDRLLLKYFLAAHESVADVY
jgi:hypothetical protein